MKDLASALVKLELIRKLADDTTVLGDRRLARLTRQALQVQRPIADTLKAYAMQAQALTGAPFAIDYDLDLPTQMRFVAASYLCVTVKLHADGHAELIVTGYDYFRAPYRQGKRLACSWVAGDRIGGQPTDAAIAEAFVVMMDPRGVVSYSHEVTLLLAQACDVRVDEAALQREVAQLAESRDPTIAEPAQRVRRLLPEV